jgi:hypothetical protein
MAFSVDEACPVNILKLKITKLAKIIRFFMNLVLDLILEKRKDVMFLFDYCIGFFMKVR